MVILSFVDYIVDTRILSYIYAYTIIIADMLFALNR